MSGQAEGQRDFLALETHTGRIDKVAGAHERSAKGACLACNRLLHAPWS